jgi:hypothetical protein
MFAARSSLQAIGGWDVDAHYATAIERIARRHEARLGDGVQLG